MLIILFSLKRVRSTTNNCSPQCIQVYITESYTILNHRVVLGFVCYRIDILSRLTSQMFSFPFLSNHLTKAPFLLLKHYEEVCTFCVFEDSPLLFACVAHAIPP